MPWKSRLVLLTQDQRDELKIIAACPIKILLSSAFIVILKGFVVSGSYFNVAFSGADNLSRVDQFTFNALMILFLIIKCYVSFGNTISVIVCSWREEQSRTFLE